MINNYSYQIHRHCSEIHQFYEPLDKSLNISASKFIQAAQETTKLSFRIKLREASEISLFPQKVTIQRPNSAQIQEWFSLTLEQTREIRNEIHQSIELFPEIESIFPRNHQEEDLKIDAPISPFPSRFSFYFFFVFFFKTLFLKSCSTRS